MRTDQKAKKDSLLQEDGVVTKITQFDRPSCKLVRSEVDAALKVIAEKFGLTYRGGAGSFAPDHFSLKSEFHVVGDCESLAEKEWNQNCVWYDLKPEHFGTTVTVYGDTIKLVGIKPKAKKYPIIGQKISSGKRYKYPAPVIQSALTQQEDNQ